MFKIKNCCVVCPLRRGTLTLFWLTLIGGVFEIMACIHVINNETDIFSIQQKKDENYDPVPMKVLMGYCIIMIFMSMLTSILGIVGMQTKKTNFLTPYLHLMVYGLMMCIATWFLAILSPTSIVYIMGYSKCSTELRRKMEEKYILPLLLIDICIFPFILYFYMIVKSSSDLLMRNSTCNNERSGDPPAYDLVNSA